LLPHVLPVLVLLILLVLLSGHIRLLFHS
jgi:hypothetical protein